MSYSMYQQGGGGRTNGVGNQGGYGDGYLDDILGPYSPPAGGRQDPPRNNGYSDQFSSYPDFSSAYSQREEPAYSGRQERPASYYSNQGRGGLDDSFDGLGGEDAILRNPYIRNNVRPVQQQQQQQQQQANRRSGVNSFTPFVGKSGGHYRTDSYAPSESSSQMEPMYTTPGNRGSAMLPRSTPAIYTLDHLATFTVSHKQRLLTPEDGMHQLRRMEKTTDNFNQKARGLLIKSKDFLNIKMQKFTNKRNECLSRQQLTIDGVWTMRVELRIDEREILVTETATQKEIECFPISYVHSPVCIRSNNSADVYNNIVIFTVNGVNNGAEMNVFQCIGISAQEVVEDIEAARSGRFPRPKKVPPPVYAKPKISTPEPRPQPVILPVIQPVALPPEPVRQPEPVREPTPAPVEPPPVVQPPPPAVQQMSDEKQKKNEDLNKCIDDIEIFVSNVQKAASNNKEYEKKKVEGASQADIDYYKQRSQPPATEEFVTILQKFKYAFNLLAYLKDSLTDPSAADLIKMLFSPLTMVLNSSRDNEGKFKLADSITSPLLTLEACRLLDKTLDAKDVDLWQSIGDSWRIPQERWQGPPVSPYVPEFSGVKPSPHSSNGVPVDPQQLRFLNELKSRNCSICQALNSRAAAAEKELSIEAGEYVEVLKNDKNWWKVSNIRNQSGFVPKTILKVIE